jgi:hypothetical protein
MYTFVVLLAGYLEGGSLQPLPLADWGNRLSRPAPILGYQDAADRTSTNFHIILADVDTI